MTTGACVVGAGAGADDWTLWSDEELEEVDGVAADDVPEDDDEPVEDEEDVDDAVEEEADAEW